MLGGTGWLATYALGLPNPNIMSGNASGGVNGHGDGTWSALNLRLSGHHYFVPAAVNTSISGASSPSPIPHFDLTTLGLGSADAAKIASSAAPVAAALTVTSSSPSTVNGTNGTTSLRQSSQQQTCPGFTSVLHSPFRSRTQPQFPPQIQLRPQSQLQRSR